jgi:hypothetical protein
LYVGPLDSDLEKERLGSLVRTIDKTQFSLSVVVDHKDVAQSPEKQNLLRDLGPDIGVLARYGKQCADPEESWVLGKYAALGNFASAEMENIYNEAYEKEFVRVFGLDVGASGKVCLFDGSGRSLFWSSLFSIRKGAKKVVFLSAENHAEYMRSPIPGKFDLAVSTANGEDAFSPDASGIRAEKHVRIESYEDINGALSGILDR